MNDSIVKGQIDNEIQRILTARGIKRDKYFDLLEKAEKYADNKGSAKDILEIADRIAPLLGINDKKEVKTTVTQEIDYSSMLKSAKVKQEITTSEPQSVLAGNFDTSIDTTSDCENEVKTEEKAETEEKG